jgi:hypothetical protein
VHLWIAFLANPCNCKSTALSTVINRVLHSLFARLARSSNIYAYPVNKSEGGKNPIFGPQKTVDFILRNCYLDTPRRNDGAALPISPQIYPISFWPKPGFSTGFTTYAQTCC